MSKEFVTESAFELQCNEVYILVVRINVAVNTIWTDVKILCLM